MVRQKGTNNMIKAREAQLGIQKAKETFALQQMEAIEEALQKKYEENIEACAKTGQPLPEGIAIEIEFSLLAEENKVKLEQAGYKVTTKAPDGVVSKEGKAWITM